MYIYGLHVIDIAVVVVYILAMVYIGKRVSKSVKNQNDFYLAGRKLGKFYQFFLNFGQMTDASGAANICSVVFRNGVAGVWIGLQTLFMTPYYWFMNVWFRRVRLVTMAELFTDRFGGKAIATLYTIFTIAMASILVGWGYLVSEKVMEAFMVKPAAQYTEKEQMVVGQYQQYKLLQDQYNKGVLSVSKFDEYQVLKNLYKKGQIKSYISYINPLVFYIVYGSIVGFYIILGGFAAAAITDAFQGILIICFSFILIPFGLVKIGGFAGLHASVPAYMFKMFGDATTSEYTWYSILAILFVSWVQIHAGMGNMSVAGSAKDEMAARFGAVSGGFIKRFMLIAWSLCGLLAIGLYSNTISDPDTSWGVLSNGLLGKGAIGLMLAGILAANMSTLDAAAIQLSALFVRNLYTPVFAGKSERHYVLVGRLVIVTILTVGIFVAIRATGIIALLKFMLGVYVTFGAPVLLLFFWRKITRTAVLWQVIICIIVLFILPLAVPLVPSFRKSKALTGQTYEQVMKITTAATQADVEAGLAQQTGQVIEKNHVRESVSLFFDSVVKSDPYNPNSSLVGVGRFNVEVFLLSYMGLDVKSMTSSGLLTIRFLFDGIFPFILLFAISGFTKTTEEEIMDRFYVKMKTPVASTPEEDVLELAKSYANPKRFEHLKLFPNSNWEFCKWDKTDFVGFTICCVIVVIILGFFWGILNVGS